MSRLFRFFVYFCLFCFVYLLGCCMLGQASAPPVSPFFCTPIIQVWLWRVTHESPLRTPHFPPDRVLTPQQGLRWSVLACPSATFNFLPSYVFSQLPGSLHWAPDACFQTRCLLMFVIFKKPFPFPEINGHVRPRNFHSSAKAHVDSYLLYPLWSSLNQFIS